MFRSRRFSRSARVLFTAGIFLTAVLAAVAAFVHVCVGPAQSLLRHAAASGSTISVRVLLALGADLNPRWPSRSTQQGSALTAAVFAHNEKVTAFLLDHGANPGVRDSNDETALGWAACSRNPRLVDLLLAHEADPNAPGRCGTMPLDHADHSGSAEIVQQLERAGARRAHVYGCG